MCACVCVHTRVCTQRNTPLSAGETYISINPDPLCLMLQPTVILRVHIKELPHYLNLFECLFLSPCHRINYSTSLIRQSVLIMLRAWAGERKSSPVLLPQIPRHESPFLVEELPLTSPSLAFERHQILPRTGTPGFFFLSNLNNSQQGKW